MALFGKKGTCPICGGDTPRLLPTEIEGQAICKECDKKISMEEDLKQELTLDGLREHLEYRENNAKILENFNDTRTVEFQHGKVLHIDDEQKLFYVDWDYKNPPVFRFDELKAFRYVEKLNERTNILENKNKYTRAVINFSREEKKRRNSYTELLEDRLVGMPRWDNIVDTLFGIDDMMVEKTKPIKYFRLVFVLKNPYWKKMKLYYLEPKLNTSDPENMGPAIRMYLKQCDDIIADAEKMAEVMTTILDD